MAIKRTNQIAETSTNLRQGVARLVLEALRAGVSATSILEIVGKGIDEGVRLYHASRQRIDAATTEGLRQ